MQLRLSASLGTVVPALLVPAYGFDFPSCWVAAVFKAGYTTLASLHILPDAAGRVVSRWIGFTGPDQIGAIRTAIAAELTRMNTIQDPTVSHSTHSSH
ncbi:MAG: hypothetical protein ACT4P6_17590 [Gemmatimonadaceae bacterium]